MDKIWNIINQLNWVEHGDVEKAQLYLAYLLKPDNLNSNEFSIWVSRVPDAFSNACRSYVNYLEYQLKIQCQKTDHNISGFLTREICSHIFGCGQECYNFHKNKPKKLIKFVEECERYYDNFHKVYNNLSHLYSYYYNLDSYIRSAQRLIEKLDIHIDKDIYKASIEAKLKDIKQMIQPLANDESWQDVLQLEDEILKTFHKIPDDISKKFEGNLFKLVGKEAPMKRYIKFIKMQGN